MIVTNNIIIHLSLELLNTFSVFNFSKFINS